MITNKSSASTNDKSRRRSSYLRAQNFAAPTVKPNTNPLYYSVDGGQSCRTNNIMFDARVCRGNTHANPVISEDQMRNREVYERTQHARRQLIERRRRERRARDGTPPPVRGRIHVSVQTEGTLDEIFGQKNIEVYGRDDPAVRDLQRPTSPSSSHKLMMEEEGNLVDNGCNAILAKNMTQIILEEAMKDAMTQLEHDRGYTSDPGSSIGSCESR